jgi:AcrR family transcriptional regulator
MDSAKTAFATQRKKRTRDALHAAMLALLAEMPFDRIQILDLTTKAKVGYATFFRHYSGTEDLLNEVAGDEIRELFRMTMPVLDQHGSRKTLQALCRYLSDRKILWRVLLTGGAAHSVRAEFIRQAVEWSRQSDGKNATAVPVELGTICAAGSTLDALAWWLEAGKAHSVEEMADFIDRLIIAPFIGGG